MAKKLLDRAINTMKASNIRITSQRLAVLEYLLNTKFHPTADEIYRALEHRFPNISPATIYNNLRALCEIDLVRELTYSNTSTRFDGDTTDHYHIICDGCGEIIDFHYPILDEVEALAEQLASYKVTHHRLEVYGKCKKCQMLKSS